MVYLPNTSLVSSVSHFESLGLRDLPFPSTAIANPYSTDSRLNGTIYTEAPVRNEIERFEQLLIRPDDFHNRVQLAYLWAKGDQQSSRGMGKTALLRYFQRRINKDWGATEFKGQQLSAAVIYVSFPSQVDRRYMEQLAWSALVDICKNNVLEASRAKLRYNELTSEQREAVLTNPGGSQSASNLLDDSILLSNGIQPGDTDAEIARRLQQEGVRPAVATALAMGKFEDHLRSLRRDENLEPFYVPRDTKSLDYSRSLLFNDMVYYLRAAGFAGGYLFIDDIENLVEQMSRRHRIAFARDFRSCTVGVGYANTAYKFFSSVLTTHQNIAGGLAQAWIEAGLASTAHLSPESPNSVELPLPSSDQARAIVVAHLDHYRIDQGEIGTIKPFTEDGLNTLLENRRTMPRELLSTAANVVSNAAREGMTTIDAATVKSAIDGSPTLATPDFTEGLADAL